MNERTYRERLDDGFETNLVKIKPPKDSQVTIEQFKQVLAIEYALNAARDLTKNLFSAGNSLDKDSVSYMAFSFASQRMRKAWEELSTEDAKDFDTMKNRLFKLLEDLTTPLSVETEMAIADREDILNVTTKNFKDIQDFLKSRVPEE